jgi:hypothetical protein
MEGELRSFIAGLSERLEFRFIDREETDLGRGYHSGKNNKT